MTGGELAALFGFSHGATHLNLEGIDDDAALRAPEPDGNPVNWIVGHIVAYRQTILAMAGATPIWDETTVGLYDGRDGAPWDGSRALPLHRLVADLDASQAQLLEALRARADADFGAPSGAYSLPFLYFHEAYHVGQLGVSRRLLGLPGAIRPPKRKEG